MNVKTKKYLQGEITMNRKFKSIVSITLIFVLLSILSGCANNYQVTHSFSVEDTKSIEFITGKFKKIVDRHEDIKSIQNILGSIPSEAVSNDVVLDGWKYEFKVIGENEDLVNKVVIYNDYLSYNNKLYIYSDQDKLYNELHELYDELEYSEVIETEIEESINTEKKNREKLPIDEAIQGFWFKDNQGSLHITPDHLIQDSYKFRYRIKEIGSDNIYITAFKESKFSLKENELFDLYLEIDDTRNNMRYKKIINQLWSSPLIYEENAVYISDDNNILGSFDSDFFYDIN